MINPSSFVWYIESVERTLDAWRKNKMSEDSALRMIQTVTEVVQLSYIDYADIPPELKLVT